MVTSMQYSYTKKIINIYQTFGSGILHNPVSGNNLAHQLLPPSRNTFCIFDFPLLLNKRGVYLKPKKGECQLDL
jgi:hypothetical protein